MIYTTQEVTNADECAPHEIDGYRDQLWKDVLND